MGKTARHQQNSTLRDDMAISMPPSWLHGNRWYWLCGVLCLFFFHDIFVFVLTDFFSLNAGSVYDCKYRILLLFLFRLFS